MLDGILDRYNAVAERFDFVVCEGSDFEGDTSAFEFNINAAIARNIDAPVLLIVDGRKVGSDGQVTNLDFAIQNFKEDDCTVLAAILNRFPADRMDQLPAFLQTSQHEDLPVFALPQDPGLAAPMMSEIAQALHAETFYRSDLLDSLQATSFSVADSSPEIFLSQLKDGALLFISGDRFGNLLGVMLKLNSTKPVNIAGIVLTNGFKPSGAVATLLKEVKNMVPVLSVPGNTFDAVNTVSRLHSRIYPGATRKITTALALFESRVDAQRLVDLLKTAKTGVVTPKMFEFGLIQRAQSPRQRIVLPEGEEDRILYAAEQVLLRGIANIILLGNEQKIRVKISHLGLNLPNVEIIQPVQSPHFRDFIQTYHELRKDKGMTPDMAETMMADSSYFGTMMVYKGLADGMVSGSINTTAHTVRPALQFIRTKPGFSIVSSVFLMCLKDRVLVYGDCAINPNPTAQQLAEIAVTSAQTAKTFGVEPRVAMLSYSTGILGGRGGCRTRPRGHRDRAQAGARPAHRRPHPVRCRHRCRRRPHQDAQLGGRRTCHRLHLPRPQHRQQHLQGRPALRRRRCHRSRSSRACANPSTTSPAAAPSPTSSTPWPSPPSRPRRTNDSAWPSAPGGTPASTTPAKP